MLLLKNYRKHVFLLFALLLQQTLASAIPQEKASYPELELYRRTLTSEQVTAYQKALKDYNNIPHVKKTYSDNKELNHHYKEIINLPDTTYDQTNLKVNEFYFLFLQAAKKGYINMELESLLQAFNVAFWSQTPSYTKAFETAILLERKLSLVSEKEYPDKRAAYLKLGEAYYLFNDFDKSIELLKHAITDNPPRSFTDCANLDARKIIGICYANVNRMDNSDYYFQSTLKSKDIVLNRPVYNAIALSHLACNAMLKGEYDKSLVLDLEVLPFLKKGDDYGHVAGMYACQCFSYFGMEESSQIAMLADSVLYYAQKDKYNRNKRLKQAYTILAKYSAKQGDIDKSQEYNDSLINIYKAEDKLCNSQYITQAKQNIAENEIETRKAEAETQRKAILIISIVFVVSVAALSVIVVLYRRTQAAYRTLVRKNQEWANSISVGSTFVLNQINDKNNNIDKLYTVGIDNPSDNVSKEDLAVMSRIFSFVVGQKQYVSPGFNLEMLSEHLGINRKYLSKAINSATGKNFNTYINEYRVKEAIRLLSDPANTLSSVDDIGIQVGFSNRTSFYESFRKMTGISPSQFKKTRKNMSGFKD
ncbi:helix-turn-helix domain-containing protein [Dysgonomonas sp. BGC7]|uniref:helix-turn-helix domain-containing protein n=1 Tax=Dysgonomonas sp. BGC7 TaxID=1658008 RepID=UPI000A9B919B|nr:helix-turn-helix domain-containing protein [Dysgonomonas sp. BGC7]MBD8387778.1 AraC family transcriptional regulator [Dysgonomonas sp. BGC7]